VSLEFLYLVVKVVKGGVELRESKERAKAFRSANSTRVHPPRTIINKSNKYTVRMRLTRRV
jgi:hypothetical protein